MWRRFSLPLPESSGKRVVSEREGETGGGGAVEGESE